MSAGRRHTFCYSTILRLSKSGAGLFSRFPSIVSHANQSWRNFSAFIPENSKAAIVCNVFWERGAMKIFELEIDPLPKFEINDTIELKYFDTILNRRFVDV